METYAKMIPEELETCARLSAEAFYDYEFFSIYIPEDERRKRFIDALIKCELKANSGKKEVTFFTAKENGKIVAVAQMCAPDFRMPSAASYIRSGCVGAIRKGGVRQVLSWFSMEEKASKPCHELHGNHWYLSLYTVEKENQGKGIGSRFLQDFLIPYVREAGGDSFSLYTNSDINCRFYEKNGFTRFDEKKFEYKGRTLGSWSYIMQLKEEERT